MSTEPLHPVRGHRDVLRALAAARSRDTLPAALLLHGPAGVGKQRVALWTAQLVLCEAPGAEGPCGACRSCRMALRLEHPDLHWYFPLPRPRGASTPEKLSDALEEARHEALAAYRAEPLRAVGGDEVTAIYLAAARTLRTRAQSRPAMGAAQVFIVADAERLVPQESSQEAANALLKLLEEPPEGTRFVLTSSEPGRLLATIRSRTVPVALAPLPDAEVEAFLVEVAGAEPGDDTARAARLGKGSIGRALGFLASGDDERAPLDETRREAYRLLAAALSPDAGARFSTALGYPPARARALLGVFGFLEEWLRDLAAVAAGERQAVLHSDAADALAKLARSAGVHPSAPARAMAAVEEARELARGNVNPQLVVTGLLDALRRELAGSATAVGAGSP